MADAKEMGEGYLTFMWHLEYGGMWPFYRRWRQLQEVVYRVRKGGGPSPFDDGRPPAKGATKIYSPGDPGDYEDEDEAA